MEAAGSNASFMRDAAILAHVLQAVVQMVRRAKQLVGHLEQKEVTGRVEYCARVFSVLYFTSLCNKAL